MWQGQSKVVVVDPTAGGRKDIPGPQGASDLENG